jgi:CRP-like cAMP-binding protein
MLVQWMAAARSASDSHKRRQRQVAAGTLVHEADTWGKSWRLLDGAIRLDHPARGGLVRLALPGDLIGAEVPIKGSYLLNATAIVSCTLEPWLPDSEDEVQETLLHELLKQQMHADEQLAMRSGPAEARLMRLIQLLTRHMAPDEQGCVSFQMPSLQDMADLLAQTIETTSRCISKLRASDTLQDLGQRHFSLRSLPVPTDQEVQSGTL